MLLLRQVDRKLRLVKGVAERLPNTRDPQPLYPFLLEGDSQALDENVYCARGDMENRIKEQQLGLFADRTSCHDWWANPCRLLLASLKSAV